LHKILLDILTFVNAAEIYFLVINSVDLKYSKLQNKSKIRKFWKRINQELNAPPDFICTLLQSGPPKTLFCTPSFH